MNRHYEQMKKREQQLTAGQAPKKKTPVKPEIAEQRRRVTASVRYSVMARDNFRCVICGRTADDGVVLHVDHIIPVSKGGKSDMDNLRTLCRDCNLGKSDKLESRC